MYDIYVQSGYLQSSVCELFPGSMGDNSGQSPG